MGDVHEPLVDLCSNPERDALRAVYAFLGECGFYVSWCVWPDEFVVINWDVEHMFWVFFEGGELLLCGPAWSGLRRKTHEPVIPPEILRKRVFELADPRCFDQIVRVLRKPSNLWS